MVLDRSELSARASLAQMTLCAPSPPAPRPSNSKSGPSANPAVERFHVTGNAIVTGGAGDLGSAVCRALLEHGLQGLAIFDVNPDEAAACISRLKADFPSVAIQFAKVDITHADEVDAAVEEVARTMGHINIFANFAGIVSCDHALDMSAAEWRRVVEVNTTGAFLAARSVARRMVASRTGGSIIFVASISGHMVNFPQSQVAYNASKAAVLMVKNSLAAEWAIHGIRVNSISPGYMNTILNEGDGLEDAKKIWLSRNPMGRMGEREELCGAVILLASKAGSYINGTDILVDGGQSLF